jgi:hypothetical protein
VGADRLNTIFEPIADNLDGLLPVMFQAGFIDVEETRYATIFGTISICREKPQNDGRVDALPDLPVWRRVCEETGRRWTRFIIPFGNIVR